MVILDWKITSPIFYRTQTFNAFCNFQYQTKVLFEILFLRCIHMATFRTSSCTSIGTSSFLCKHYNIFSLKCNTKKKENSIFYTFMILHFFQTCIENSSHIPYFELFRKVFLFSVHAHICRCKIGLRFIDAMLKICLKNRNIFYKKKRFCTYYSEIRGLCSTKCSID